MTPISIGK